MQGESCEHARLRAQFRGSQHAAGHFQTAAGGPCSARSRLSRITRLTVSSAMVDGLRRERESTASRRSVVLVGCVGCSAGTPYPNSVEFEDEMLSRSSSVLIDQRQSISASRLGPAPPQSTMPVTGPCTPATPGSAAAVRAILRRVVGARRVLRARASARAVPRLPARCGPLSNRCGRSLLGTQQAEPNNPADGLICDGRWSQARAREHREQTFGCSRGLCRLQRWHAVSQFG